MKMKTATQKLFIMLFIVSILVGCNQGSVDKSTSHSADPSKDSVVQFLLTSSATDFHTNQHPAPVQFRNVRIGYMTGPDAEKVYVMCGEFLSQDKQDKDQWIPFATIRTSDYEQWLGSQALRFCNDSTVTWSKAADDLSTRLKDQMDSMH